jgi:hypothetical protein
MNMLSEHEEAPDTGNVGTDQAIFRRILKIVVQTPLALFSETGLRQMRSTNALAEHVAPAKVESARKRAMVPYVGKR